MAEKKAQMDVEDAKSIDLASTASSKRTQLSVNTLHHFVQYSNPCDPVTAIPGVKKANAEIFAKQKIHFTHQLIGKFLLLKQDAEIDSVKNCALFEAWLKEVGIKNHRQSIVQSIAAKTSVMFPDLHL